MDPGSSSQYSAYGATTGLIYLATRQLVRPSAALFAAAIYATDAVVIHLARGVRLEPLLGAIVYSWTDGSIAHMHMASSGDDVQELELLPVVVNP